MVDSMLIILATENGGSALYTDKPLTFVDGSVVATDSYKVSVYYHYIYYDNMYYTVQVRIDERIDYFSINVENMNTMMMNTYVYHRNDYLTNNPIISSILGYDLSKIESEIVKPPRNIEYLENLMLKRILDTI